MTNVGVTSRYFRDGLDAYLIPARSEKQLAQAVLRLANNPALLDRMSGNSESFLQKNGFMKEEVLRRHEEVYKKLKSLSSW